MLKSGIQFWVILTFLGLNSQFFSGIYFDSSIILDLDVMLFMELCAATNFK